MSNEMDERWMTNWFADDSLAVGMTWGFSRPVTRRSVLAGWLPARPAPSLVHRMAMGLQPASRPARRQAWYIYGPIFFDITSLASAAGPG